GVFLACRHIPQFDRAVAAGRRQYLAVRSERHAAHPVCVPLENGPRFLARRVSGLGDRWPFALVVLRDRGSLPVARLPALVFVGRAAPRPSHYDGPDYSS